MGSSYNQEYVSATKYQADINAQIAADSNETDKEIAFYQADAVKHQADADLKARMQETADNLKVQMEALRVREAEAEMQYKVDWKNAQNDSIRADAAYNSSNADVIEAEAERDEASYEHEEEMSKYGNSSSENYWYGY